jgi:hypothetical protein
VSLKSKSRTQSQLWIFEYYRWNDSSTQSRDLIDLAILRVNNEIPAHAIAKAEEIYEVKKPLVKAITNFTEKERYRDKCFQELNIPEEKFPVIMDGINWLLVDFESMN